MASDVRSVAIKPALYGEDSASAYRLRKYGEVKLDHEGRFSVPGKYWSIDMRQMKRLRDMGICRIDTVGESTFAVAL